MAYYNDVAHRSDFVERALSAAGRLLSTLAERRARNRVYRTTLDELRSLSNRELADLGLHRTELKRIAWESAKDVARA